MELNEAIFFPKKICCGTMGTQVLITGSSTKVTKLCINLENDHVSVTAAVLFCLRFFFSHCVKYSQLS